MTHQFLGSQLSMCSFLTRPFSQSSIPDPSLRHSAIQALQSQVSQLQKTLYEKNQELQGYVSLPPDVQLATLKVEEKRCELVSCLSTILHIVMVGSFLVARPNSIQCERIYFLKLLEVYNNHVSNFLLAGP